MTLIESNYWLTTASLPAATAGELCSRVDVAVIGAGFTGLSAAKALAQRGARVAVLEANTIGWGASSRNAGMVLAGLKLTPERLAERYGLEMARQMYSLSRQAIDLVEHIVAQERIDCNFSRCGYLEVACKQSHFDAYQRSADFRAQQLNHEIRIVPRSELATEVGSNIYYGGWIDEASAGVNPARYVAGLAAAALRAGAAIYENVRLVEMGRASKNGGSGFELHTSRGRISAKEVLVATSGYTSSATPALKKKVIPIGSFIIATERLPEPLARQISPRNRMISDSKHYLHYYRLTPDNRMLFGGRAAFFPETKSTIERSRDILRRDMLRVFPPLGDTKIDYAWGGTLDFCFDTMPHCGQAEGVYYALGYAGHGVAMATYLGTKMAEKICGVEGKLPFAAIPFPGAPLGLYNGRPWFLPFAGAYYKFLDWIS
jgi:glycine/D-amino acid oxidase-like deaminating enzyme